MATLRLDSLELARGHDGLLRGEPEPLVLVAIFGCGASHARLLDRRVVRFRTPSDIPCTLAPRESVVMAPMLAEDDSSVLVLTIGIEVDGGEAVERLFGALERSERLAAWVVGDAVPDPRHLEDLAASAPARLRAERIELLLDGSPIHHLGGDDVVGAAVTSLDASTRSLRDARFTMVSADERNDWTARARVGVRARPSPSPRSR